MSISPNEKYVAAGSADGGGSVWSLPNGTEVIRLDGKGFPYITQCEWHPSSGLLLTKLSNGKVLLRRVPSGDVVAESSSGFPFSFTPDGRHVLELGGLDLLNLEFRKVRSFMEAYQSRNEAFLYTTRMGKQREVRRPKPIASAFTDNNTAVIVNEAGQVYYLTLTSPPRSHRVTVSPDAAVSHDGSTMAVGGGRFVHEILAPYPSEIYVASPLTRLAEVLTKILGEVRLALSHNGNYGSSQK